MGQWPDGLPSGGAVPNRRAFFRSSCMRTWISPSVFLLLTLTCLESVEKTRFCGANKFRPGGKEIASPQAPPYPNSLLQEITHAWLIRPPSCSQGVAAAPAAPPFTTIQPIGAGGGWGELTFRATEDNKNIFYLGAGTDDPRNQQLMPGTTRAKNTFAWVSYFRKLTIDVTLG